MKFNEHTIDLMIVSHNHADHITGLNRVLERYDVKKVWVSGAIHTTNEYIKLLETIKKRGIPTEVVGSGKEEVYDGVTVQVVHPLTNQAGKRPEDQHDATIVTRIDYQQKRLLLTGDINEGHEQAMLDAKQDVAADILKVAHHGSKSGLLPAFLTAVNPKAAIISVGPNNSFGHPAPSILDRLMAAKVAVWRTDEDGTVTCVINSQVSCKGSR